jgi:hypothetical chaperone protein
LHQAVQRTKIALSQQDQAEFAFRDHGFNLRASVTRAEFESWIQSDLATIEQAIAEVMTNSGVHDFAVDRIFLTGGSSLVPAVRRIFERRFGPDRITAGNEFTSVASGLALRARTSHHALIA